MAQQSADPTLNPSKRRGPGRPRKSSLEPPAKRLKRDAEATLQRDVTDACSRETKFRGLPSKLSNSQTLPVLSSPQAPDLSDAEYATVGTSGVLASSLERSRMSWTHAGIFERYWTKPETGKGAAPAPPNNPDVKSMRSRGRCRLRIEPHIFEVEVFVVDRPRPPAPKPYHAVKQQSKVLQQQWHNAQQFVPSHRSPSASPFGSPHVNPPNASAKDNKSLQQKGAKADTLDQKSITDPVIGMLAERAGHDSELKALMQEVATGDATPTQVEVFQRHINDLTALMNAQNKQNDQERNAMHPQHKSSMRAPAPVAAQSSSLMPQRQHLPGQHASHAPVAPPSAPEVVFAFMTPGACADRFLFPQHSLIEMLTPQHILASFFVTRRGSDAVDPSSFDPDKTYFFPVTIMVEVAYGRELILADIKRWVKPANEAREHMFSIMAKHERLIPSHLALRLPLKSSTDSSSMPSSHAGTPVPMGPEQKERKKRESKLQMPAAMYKKRGITTTTGAEVEGITDTSLESKHDVSTAQSAGQATLPTQLDGSSTDVVDDENAAKKDTSTSENRRSTRTTRKSSRLSEL